MCICYPFFKDIETLRLEVWSELFVGLGETTINLFPANAAVGKARNSPFAE